MKGSFPSELVGVCPHKASVIQRAVFLSENPKNYLIDYA